MFGGLKHTIVIPAALQRSAKTAGTRKASRLSLLPFLTLAFAAVFVVCAPAKSYAAPTACPTIGDVCPDGTIYAGDHPDDGEPLFITTGAYETTAAWDDGTSENDPADSMAFGSTNTSNLLTPGFGGQTSTVHAAADYCANTLDGTHGYNDWYLPAQNELSLIYDNLVDQNADNTPGGPLGDPAILYGFTTNIYWSSSEDMNTNTFGLSFNDRSLATAPKSATLPLRCMRSGGDGYMNMPCNADYEAVMFYNDDQNVLQYCDGTDWIDMGPRDPSVPSNCPVIGDMCDDGTIYVGISPDGSIPMYTTPCDAGRVWDGNVCTGAASALAWNDGTGNYLDTPLEDCANTEAACRTGAANTSFLAGRDSATTTSGIEPHTAIEYCENLTAENHSDWYLPSMAELDTMYVNLVAPGDPDNPTYADGPSGGGGDPALINGPRASTFNTTGANPAGFYYSSSENFTSSAWRIRFSDGFSGNGGKNNALTIRCVRKDNRAATYDTTCSSPTGAEGEVGYNFTHGVLQYCNGSNWINMGPISSGSAPAGAVPTAGLVGHWALDESGDVNIAADSAGANNGTLTGFPGDESANWVSGRMGNALDFDGGDDYISIPDDNALDLTTTVTIAAWVNGNDWANTECNFIVAKNDRQAGEMRNYQLCVHTSGAARFGFSEGGLDGNISSNTTLNTGTWYHVVATYDQTNIELYINGTLDNSVAETDAMTPNTNQLSIGRAQRDNNSDYGEWDGLIDDVRIYNVALDADEVEALYEGTGGGAGLDPCAVAASPAPGTVCADGTIYVGEMDVDGIAGDEKIFVTSEAYEGTGINWAGGAQDADDPADSSTNGLANTTDLLTPGAGGQIHTNHPAAEYCLNTLDTADGGSPAHGQNDWYLPALNEIALVYSNLINSGLDTDGDADFKSDTFGFWIDESAPGDNEFYWSSTEDMGSNAWSYSFYDVSHLFIGQESGFDKSIGSLSVRCMRRGAAAPAGGSCSAPPGVAGELVYNDDHNVMQFCNGTEWIGIAKGDTSGGGGGGGPADPCDSVGPGDEGTVCDDGSVYAGRIDGDGTGPGGDVDIFATPYDLDNSPHTAPDVMTDGITDRGAFAYKTSNTQSSVDECSTLTNDPSCHDGQTLTDQLVNGTGPDGANNPSEHHAAIACDNLSFGGQGDWYLPAAHELGLIYDNLVVGAPDANTDDITDDFGFEISGGFAAGWYWSSSERLFGNSWNQNFSNGFRPNFTKNVAASVRCVRRE